MTSQPDELAPESEPDRQDAVRHTAVALRSIGQPNSVAVEFDFWDGRYEGRRPFSELLGTFFLVLVAVAGGLVAVRIAYVLRGRGGGRSGVAAAEGTIGVDWRLGHPAAAVRSGVRCSPVRLRNVAGARNRPWSRPAG